MQATDRLPTAATLTACLLAALFLPASACPAQAPAALGRLVVNEVIPQGNSLVPTAKVMSLLHTRAGAEFDQDTVNDDVRRLVETRRFGNVQVRLEYLPGNKVNVRFLLTEYAAAIREVVYRGARHLKDEELTNLTGLHKGDPLNPAANRMACQAIEQRYQADGRLFASCTVAEGDRPGDTRVVLDITEGPVIKVAGIDFVGATFVSAARLRTQIGSGAEWFPHTLGISGVYNPTLAQLDAARLEEYYRTYGYEDVRVQPECVYQGDGRHVRLVYHVREGPRYKVAGVEVVGVHSFTTEQIAALPKLHRGDVFSGQQADADVNAIKDYYGWAGYPAVVKKELFFPQPGLCLVRYDVQERPQARVGQILVVGNDVTRENVIRRQVPLYPGQPLAYPQVQAAEQNLGRLGIFGDPATGARPTVTVLDPEGDSPFRDVLVSVQEQRTSSLLFGLGVSSDAGVTGSVIYNERNFDITRVPTSLDDFLSGRAFRGAGQEFQIEAMPGTQLQNYTVTWRDPFLLDSPYSLALSGYYHTRQYNEYDESRLGGRATLGRQLNDVWSVSGTVRVEDVGVHDVSAFAPDDFTSVVGDHLLIGTRLDVVRDTRDSRIRPTSGNRLDVSFEEVTGDFTFPIARAQWDQYWTVYQRPDGSGKHVLALRSQFGWEGGDAPVYERFYAGGFETLRGFAFRGVGPNVNGYETGGDFLLLNSLEYQVPLRADDRAYFVTFVDSGTVEPSLELKDYRVSVGFGLRFLLPVLGQMPIALDCGFPVVRAAGDHEQVFSFSLGFLH
jgi:outer membrane protein assembly complex protein YaeT